MSSSLERGTHVHRFVEVGEEQFRTECHVWPADLLTASGARSTSAEAKKWVASLPKGATILTRAELDSITDQCHAILENTAARDLLEQVKWREFVVNWEQEGTPMRCRGDAATPDFWIDLKTTSKPDILETWWRSVKDFKYHVQAAVYGWAARAAGWPEHDMHFIVSCTAPPYECQVVTLPRWYVTQADLQASLALEELNDRVSLDYWLPRGSGEVHELAIPRFLEDE